MDKQSLTLPRGSSEILAIAIPARMKVQMPARSHGHMARLEKRPFPSADGDFICIDRIPEYRPRQGGFAFSQMPFPAGRTEIRLGMVIVGIKIQPAHA